MFPTQELSSSRHTLRSVCIGRCWRARRCFARPATPRCDKAPFSRINVRGFHKQRCGTLPGRWGPFRHQFGVVSISIDCHHACIWRFSGMPRLPNQGGQHTKSGHTRPHQRVTRTQRRPPKDETELRATGCSEWHTTLANEGPYADLTPVFHYVRCFIYTRTTGTWSLERHFPSLEVRL